MAVYKPPGF